MKRMNTSTPKKRETVNAVTKLNKNVRIKKPKTNDKNGRTIKKTIKHVNNAVLKYSCIDIFILALCMLDLSSERYGTSFSTLSPKILKASLL